VEIEISGSGGYRISTVTETQLTQDMVANAADLSSGLTSNGHVVVSGILFDAGRDVVKPESSAALDEVVKMLKADAKMKVYVVGHTDNVGGLPANMDLSKCRAAAVVQLLTTKYAIPPTGSNALAQVLTRRSRPTISKTDVRPIAAWSR
jgi:OOP family OmpA-OmpF porin